MTTHVIPPVVEVAIANNIDVMRAGDATRRVADLRGFSPIYQAMIAGAAMSFAEWLCQTQREHVIEVYGIREDNKSALRISTTLDWLKQAPVKNIEDAMQIKLAGLVDDVAFIRGTQSVLQLTVWLTKERQAQINRKGGIA